MMIVLLAGLQSLPPEVFEARGWTAPATGKIFRHITFPMLAPVSITVIVIRALEAFKLFDIVMVMTGGGPGTSTETVTMYAYLVGMKNGNLGYASAIAYSLLIMVIIFSTIFLQLNTRSACRGGRMRCQHASDNPTIPTHQESHHLHPARQSGRLSACFRSIGCSSPRSSSRSRSFKDPSTSPGLTFKPTLNAWKFLLTGPTSAACSAAGPTAPSWRLSSAAIAVAIGALAGYGTDPFHYYWCRTKWRNNDIAFWIISQRMLPPVVVILPYLIMFRVFGLIDTHRRDDPGLHRLQPAVRSVDHARLLRRPAGRPGGERVDRRRHRACRRFA